MSNQESRELELKLAIDPEQRENALQVCRELAENAEQLKNYQQLELENAYFDTSDLRLRQFDMGLRIRRSGDQLEQTIKLSGRVLGGMHERPEYNVPVAEMNPDLTLFDEDIWPDDFPVYDIQRDLKQLFITDFSRHQWVLSSGSGQIEMVLDLGAVKVAEQQQTIAEIELELQGGELDDIYRLGEQLVNRLNARMGSLSKAARGYLLAGRSVLEPFVQTHFVNIKPEHSLAEALYRSLEYGLRHWQHNESCLDQHANVRAAQGMADGVYLCKAVLEQLQQMTVDTGDLIEQINEVQRHLTWLKRFEGLAELTAEDGAYHRALKHETNLYAALEDQQQQVVQLKQLKKLVRSAKYQLLLLNLSRLLIDRPATESMQQPCETWATTLLREDWREVQQEFAEAEQISEERYLKLLPKLQHSLMLGTCFGQLFDATVRDTFRSPWQDLARGIREITALHILHEIVKNNDDISDEKLIDWQNMQRESLLTALEYSRKAALKREPYWQV
ncbi:CYTH domain-containing protein [Idiomarina seosinensis]|uniref:CYTH domain-containing protein n=1 Tax=Idiomarina seosinensis TaxID=281739 RepID=UPI00384CEBEF